MRKQSSSSLVKFLSAAFCLGLLVVTSASDVHARAGGGRSFGGGFGGRGSRSFSAPMRPSMPFQQARPAGAPQQPYTQPVPPQQPYAQPAPMGGGFFRNLAGGLVGGMVGSMLFRSLGFGGGMGDGLGGGMGGGSGLLQILLLGGLLFVVYKLFTGRRESLAPQSPAPQGPSFPFGLGRGAPANNDASPAFEAVSFDPEKFKETAQDIFFKVQGAWTRSDLSLVRSVVSPEMIAVFQQDLDLLKRRGEINRLENIAIREVELTEVWNESGTEYATVRFLANLLDYHTNEAGQVVSGSNSEPVKFEEYWTFKRSGEHSPWMLSALQQG